MIKALENPHLKKIWEEVNWKIRHPEAKSLEEALKMEAQKNGCILYDVDSKRYFTVFECNYTDEESISLQCISDTGGSTVITYKKANSKQEILGRPITLEDILNILDQRKLGSTGTQYQIHTNKDFVIVGIDGYVETGEEPQFNYLGDFSWKLTYPLHEQTPEAWEKIYEIMNQK